MFPPISLLALPLVSLVAMPLAQAVTVDEALAHHATLAHAIYEDTATTARQLQTALHTLVANPTAETLAAAKTAWLAAREPYGQSEVFRFQNGPIDDLNENGEMVPGKGREGFINAWPLDEALIDYSVPVDGNASNEDQPKANLIADLAFDITPATLSGLNELGENEANVTTGYHAIEFLLWGQDLNEGGEPFDGTARRDSTPGQRPVTDFLADDRCTSGKESAPAIICQRRGQYLLAAAALLATDLDRIAQAWAPNADNYRTAFVKGGKDSLLKILVGMGSLSYGELAGERILVALAANSQEDEHSCFSDNTHRDIYLNALAVRNVARGEYTRVNGDNLDGPGILDLLTAQGSSELAQQLQKALDDTQQSAQVLVDLAAKGLPFDRLIEQFPSEDGDGRPVLNANLANNARVNEVVMALQAQTALIESAITALLGDTPYEIEDSPAFSGT